MHELMQTFLGFVHSDTQAEKVKLFSSLLCSPVTLSLGLTPRLCAQHVSCTYACASVPPRRWHLSWLPSSLPTCSPSLLFELLACPARSITIDSPQSCERGHLNKNTIISRFCLRLYSVFPLHLGKNQIPNSLLSITFHSEPYLR